MVMGSTIGLRTWSSYAATAIAGPTRTVGGTATSGRARRWIRAVATAGGAQAGARSLANLPADEAEERGGGPARRRIFRVGTRRLRGRRRRPDRARPDADGADRPARQGRVHRRGRCHLRGGQRRDRQLGGE